MTVDEQLRVESFKADQQREIEEKKLNYQFRVEEFKSLRGEIDSLVKETRNLEIYVAGALVAYYVWLITHCLNEIPIPIPLLQIKGGYGLQWLIPMALPILGAWRSWANIGRIMDIAAYITKVEERFDHICLPLGPEKGWEHFLEKRRNKTWARRGSHVAVWLLLLAITIIVPPFGIAQNIGTCEAEKAKTAVDRGQH
jgi:hypothetical protein